MTFMAVLLTLEAILSTVRQSSDFRRFAFEQLWQDDHKVVFHHEQDPLNIDPEASKRIDGKTLCSRLGICVCKQPQVILFCQKLFKHMKGFFVKIGRIAGEARALLEGCYIVIHLRSHQQTMNEEDDSRELFFHVGYINFSTWHFSGPSLHRWMDDDVNKTTILTFGNPADGEDSPLHWINEIQTVWEFVSHHMNLDLAWNVQYKKILNDDAMVPRHLMPARYVEIGSFSEETSLWNGWQNEKPKRRNKKTNSKDNAEQVFRAVAGASSSKRARVDTGSAGDQSDQGKGEEEDLSMLVSEFLQELDHAEGLEDAQEANQDDSDSLETILAEMLDVLDSKDQESGMQEREADVPAIPEGLAATEPEHDLVALFDGLDDEDGPPNPERARPSERAPEVNLRRPKVPEDTIIVTTTIGELRYNSKLRFLRAHCYVHGSECRRQRQTTAGRKYGSGRPIGALVAWLQDGVNHSTQAEHVACGTASFQKRKEAREFFVRQGGSDRFLAYEREAKAAEGGDEPRWFN